MTFPFSAQQGLVIVTATVIGPSSTGSLRLALDTGATYTVINGTLLVPLGYDLALASHQVKITTASGVAFVPQLPLLKINALGQDRAAMAPRFVRTGQPPNPVPCLLLGQLATDLAWAGRGIGTGLLRHALMRSVAGAQLIGGRALIVNALDEEAAVFWRRHGFIPSKDQPLTLFRSIPDIAASLAASAAR